MVPRTLRLAELTVEMVRKAVDAYLGLAYGSGGSTRGRGDLDLTDGAPVEQILGLFQRELVAEGDGKPCARYWLRLGNRNYPFMKLLLQEHIVPGEFYFAVDTHDELGIKPDFPDYEAWLQLQRFNRNLRGEIEERFRQLGLPTSASLHAAWEQREGGKRARARAGRQPGELHVVVVDDEVHLAAAVAAVFRSRGYRARVANDGRAGLAAIRAARTDLVVLDLEMPEMDGLEVIAALKGDPLTSSIPVLLCTASKVSLQDMRKADGFLAKPYQESLLFDVVDRLLGGPKPEGQP